MRIRRGGPVAAEAVALDGGRRTGQRIGALLVEHAVKLARDAGVRLLRVDCWAGAPRLVEFYEAQGFVRDGTFDVGGWTGQVFSMRLGHQPGTLAR